MKRLLLLGLVAAAIWYGWKTFPGLTTSRANDVEVINHSGRAVLRLRISVADQTVVVETLEDGATTHVPLRSEREGPFHVIWASRGVLGEREWSGGSFTGGPTLHRYRFEFGTDGSVMCSSEVKS